MVPSVKVKQFIFLNLSLFSSVALSQVIYGIENIPNHPEHFKYPVYVQMGNFDKSTSADKMYCRYFNRVYHYFLSIQSNRLTQWKNRWQKLNFNGGNFPPLLFFQKNGCKYEISNLL